MVKQAVYTLADKLRGVGTPGVRLVPIVLFVQRIVFLIRDGARGGLLQLYVESMYAGKKHDGWRRMLMQALLDLMAAQPSFAFAIKARYSCTQFPPHSHPLS